MSQNRNEAERVMTSPWQPYRESLRTTLVRTVTIALVVGAVLACTWRGLAWAGLARWPIATLLALWPSLGGHYVEMGFLNWLRPRLPSERAVQVATRFAVWFIGGIGLALCMGLTAWALVGFHLPRWPGWWIGGLAFIGVELVAHVALQARGRPSFYNGRG